MTAAGIAGFREREAAIAAVIGYANALDARDWVAYRALFTNQIVIDYGAIGSIVATLPADAWTDRCRVLEGFDATGHRLNNLVCTVEGDIACVTSLVDAVHFLTIDSRVETAQLVGRYRHDLERRAGAWLITGVGLAVIGFPGGQASFDAGFSAARANFAARNAA